MIYHLFSILRKKIFSIEVTFIEFKSFMEPLNDESNKDNLDDDLKRLWDSIEKKKKRARDS
jgi:hypothetical protein